MRLLASIQIGCSLLACLVDAKSMDKEMEDAVNYLPATPSTSTTKKFIRHGGFIRELELNSNEISSASGSDGTIPIKSMSSIHEPDQENITSMPTSTPTIEPPPSPATTPIASPIPSPTPPTTFVQTPEPSSFAPSQTPAPTLTRTPSQTPASTPIQTPDRTPSQTPSETPITTPTQTPDRTPSQTPSETPIATPTQTPNSTPSQTPSETPIATPTQTPDRTPPPTPSETPIATPTQTPDRTPTQTPSETPIATPTQTPNSTPSQTPSETPIATPTQTPNSTPSQTPSATPFATPTQTPDRTPPPTPSETPIATPTQTPDRTPTQTPSETPIATPTQTPNSTPSQTPSATPFATPTQTPVTLPALTPSETPVPTTTQAPYPTPSQTPSLTPAPTTSAKPVTTPSITASKTPGSTPYPSSTQATTPKSTPVTSSLTTPPTTSSPPKSSAIPTEKPTNTPQRTETTPTPMPTTNKLNSQIEYNPTELPKGGPGNRGNWPAQRAQAKSLSTLDDVLQKLPSVLLAFGLIPLIGFYIGLWTPGPNVTPAPWLLPHALWGIQAFTSVSFFNFGDTSITVPLSLLHTTDSLSWVHFLVPGQQGSTSPARRILLEDTGVGAESFALRQSLDEKKLFLRCWIAILIVFGVLSLCQAIATLLHRRNSTPLLETIRQRLWLGMTVALMITLFPLCAIAAYEARQDSFTIDSPHTSGIIAGITIAVVVLCSLLFVLRVYLLNEEEFKQKGVDTWFPWLYGSVHYNKRVFGTLPIVLQVVGGAISGGVASSMVALAMIVIHTIYLGCVWRYTIYKTQLQFRIVMAMEVALILSWLLVWIGAYQDSESTQSGLGYTVVIILFVSIVALVIFQVTLVWSACASYSPLNRNRPERQQAPRREPHVDEGRPRHRHGTVRSNKTAISEMYRPVNDST